MLLYEIPEVPISFGVKESLLSGPECITSKQQNSFHLLRNERVKAERLIFNEQRRKTNSAVVTLTSAPDHYKNMVPDQNFDPW